MKRLLCVYVGARERHASRRKCVACCCLWGDNTMEALIVMESGA